MPKRVLNGVVVTAGGDKTIIVRVERRVMHPMYKKFIRRFQYIEQEVAKEGKTLKETPLDELERYWQEAKTKAK